MAPPPPCFFSTLSSLLQIPFASLPPASPLPYPHAQPPSRSRSLLVAHDFQGGYSEDPSCQGYSFEWLSWVDVFIYFSHHRITIPPPQWVIAAHTHDSRILGTLIFEHADARDDLELLLHGPPPSTPAAVHPNSARFYLNLSDPTAPYVSTYFADRLIDLAIQSNFQGWLINIELDLFNLYASPLQAAQISRSIKVWVQYLRLHGQLRVGPDWEICWYDSLSHRTGQLHSQSRIHSLHNLPFFSAASSLFLDYHWTTQHIQATNSLIQKLSALSPPSRAQANVPLLDRTANVSASSIESLFGADHHTSDQLKHRVYFGVDVFGRGCPYGGGFSSWRAAHEAIKSGYSTALFAPGWTWESHHLHPSRQAEKSLGWWQSWWRDEMYFWVGLCSPFQAHHPQCRKVEDVDHHQLVRLEPPNARVDSCRIAKEANHPLTVAGAASRTSELPEHQPFSKLFPIRRAALKKYFYTNWSFGSGSNGFWVQGEKRHVRRGGAKGIKEWSDMSMSFPINDLSLPGSSVWSIGDDGNHSGPLDVGWIGCELVDKVGWLGSGSIELQTPVTWPPIPPSGEPASQARSGRSNYVWMNTTWVDCQQKKMRYRLVWKPKEECERQRVFLGLALQFEDDVPGKWPSFHKLTCEVDGQAEVSIVVFGCGKECVEEKPVIRCGPLVKGWYETVCEMSVSSNQIFKLGVTLPLDMSLVDGYHLGELSVVPLPHQQTENIKITSLCWEPHLGSVAASKQCSLPQTPLPMKTLNGVLSWEIVGSTHQPERQVLMFLVYVAEMKPGGEGVWEEEILVAKARADPTATRPPCDIPRGGTESSEPARNLKLWTRIDDYSLPDNTPTAAVGRPPSWEPREGNELTEDGTVKKASLAALGMCEGLRPAIKILVKWIGIDGCLHHHQADGDNEQIVCI